MTRTSKVASFMDATPGDWIADGQGHPHWQTVRNDGRTITYLHNGAEQSESIYNIGAMGFRLVKTTC